jgi:hypothetical protein
VLLNPGFQGEVEDAAGQERPLHWVGRLSGLQELLDLDRQGLQKEAPGGGGR